MAYEVEDKKTNAFDDLVNQARQNSSAGAAQQRPAGVTDLVIILWGNGFQINENGPFRALNDPTNTTFVD